MVSVTFLGTACGVPVPHRFHSSAMVRAGSHAVLVDAGEPCATTLKTLNVALTSIDAILLTHGHSDHIAGLPMLLQGSWLQKRTRPLPIVLPAELIEPLRGWLAAVYLPEKILGFPIQWIAWETAEEWRAGTLRAVPKSTTHLDSLRALINPSDEQRFRAYSIRLDFMEKRILFSGDMGAPQDLASQLGEPIDVLICELAHFSAEELFAFLRDRPIRQLWLTHLHPDYLRAVDHLQEQAAKMLPEVAIRVVNDGDTLFC